MESEIKELVKKEQTWLNYLKSWGCNPDTAKDLVQELYITIDKWLKKHNKSLMYNDKEVNWYFVYITLRNLFLDLKRQEAKVSIVSLDHSDKIKASLVVEQYQEIEDNKFEKHQSIEEWLLNDDYLQMTNIIYIYIYIYIYIIYYILYILYYMLYIIYYTLHRLRNKDA